MIFIPVMLVLLLLSMGSSGCSDISEEQQAQINQALRDSLISVTESWGVSMQLVQDGRNIVEITGEYAALHEKQRQNETQIKGPVFITVYDDSGKVSAEVRSERAIYRSKKMEFECFGNVEVNARNERRLKSEYLYWNRTIDSVKTPNFVVITTPQDSIAGTGFRGTVDLSSYKIENVSGRVEIDS